MRYMIPDPQPQLQSKIDYLRHQARYASSFLERKTILMQLASLHSRALSHDQRASGNTPGHNI